MTAISMHVVPFLLWSCLPLECMSQGQRHNQKAQPRLVWFATERERANEFASLKFMKCSLGMLCNKPRVKGIHIEIFQPLISLLVVSVCQTVVLSSPHIIIINQQLCPCHLSNKATVISTAALFNQQLLHKVTLFIAVMASSYSLLLSFLS